jgi:hypothetical protein
LFSPKGKQKRLAASLVLFLLPWLVGTAPQATDNENDDDDEDEWFVKLADCLEV